MLLLTHQPQWQREHRQYQYLDLLAPICIAVQPELEPDPNRPKTELHRHPQGLQPASQLAPQLREGAAC